jgi:hypothetical protein
MAGRDLEHPRPLLVARFLRPHEDVSVRRGRNKPHSEADRQPGLLAVLVVRDPNLVAIPTLPRNS